MRASKNITVILGGRSYSLTVSTDEEHLVRRVVKDINEKINYYQVNYKQDKQDSLSMALLTCAVDFAKYQKAHSNQHTVDKINQLDLLLDHALKINQ